MKCRARDFLLDGAPRLGRPVQVDSNQIETLIKNSQRYATWKISNMFKKINKVIGENEKSVLFYRRKTKSVFGQPNILYLSCRFEMFSDKRWKEKSIMGAIQHFSVLGFTIEHSLL